MLPVKPELVAVLGTVETMKAKQIKHLSEKRFHNEVEVHEELNLDILRQGISIIEDNVNEEWRFDAKKRGKKYDRKNDSTFYTLGAFGNNNAEALFIIIFIIQSCQKNN